MRIIHFGDIHLWHWAMDWSDCLYPKRWLAYVNLGLRRRQKFPPEYGAMVMAELVKMDADAVIFSGDFSTGAMTQEFEAAAKLMAPVREKWGDRFIAIPGNHDRYTPKVTRQRRYEQAFPYGELDGLRSVELGDNTVVVAFDVCVPCKIRSNGVFDAPRATALRAELARHQAAGKTVVLVGHYPYDTLPEHPESWEHKLIGEELLAEVVAEYKPAIYLHGHKHVRWLIRPGVTPDTLCLNCGSAGMTSSSFEKMAGFVSFDIAPDGVVSEVRSHTLVPDEARMETRDLAVFEGETAGSVGMS